jgi:predicted transcriptional regulator
LRMRFDPDMVVTINKSFKDKSSHGKFSRGESNFSKYVEVYRELLLLNEENNLATTLKNIQELLSFSEKIFSSSAVAETFLYFCLHGASTAWVLQNELNLPEATVYRAMKRLRALGIVVPALKVSKVKNSKGGPRPTVWSLERSSTQEISRALKVHYQMLSPKYRVAEEVAQTILDQYISTRKASKISYREIVIQIKEMRVPFSAPDIAELAAKYLHEKGVKVWR